MDKRQYVQRVRAEAADATRRRILDAARATLERGPSGALRVEEVARTAGVSRSTVYLLYGSRAGLFDALARHLRLEAGFDELHPRVPPAGRARGDAWLAAGRGPDVREDAGAGPGDVHDGGRRS